MTMRRAAPLLAALTFGVFSGCAKPVDQPAEAAADNTADTESIMRQRATAMIAALSDGGRRSL